MEAAVYDLPFASWPTRKPCTPMEVPMPDLDRFNLIGPSLMLLRNRHAMSRQFYRRQRRAGRTGRADLWGGLPWEPPEAGAFPPASNPLQRRAWLARLPGICFAELEHSRPVAWECRAWRMIVGPRIVCVSSTSPATMHFLRDAWILTIGRFSLFRSGFRITMGSVSLSLRT
jgi:hypothetical protein